MGAAKHSNIELHTLLIVAHPMGICTFAYVSHNSTKRILHNKQGASSQPETSTSKQGETCRTEQMRACVWQFEFCVGVDSVSDTFCLLPFHISCECALWLGTRTCVCSLCVRQHKTHVRYSIYYNRSTRGCQTSLALPLLSWGEGGWRRARLRGRELGCICTLAIA